MVNQYFYDVYKLMKNLVERMIVVNLVLNILN